VLEPPDLDHDQLVGALEAAYGIDVAALAFLPIGNDPASWSYRVEQAGGPARFLKVRAGQGMPGAAVPAHLHRHRVPNVLAPLPTTGGRPFAHLDGFAIALYPLLEATTGADTGLTPAQWRQLGAAVRQVHAVPPPPGLVGRETFRPAGRELVPELEARLADPPPDDGPARALAASWRAHRHAVRAVAERTDRLGGRLAGEPFSEVLCHADLHTWNVLVDDGRRLWIVDWDEAVLAPKERDLMFVIGGGLRRDLVAPADTDRFLAGYGDAAADPRLLAYYRAAWAVQDVVAYGREVLMAPGLGERSRWAAVDGFRSLFAPGNIVDLALLPPQW
jgi:spectinomycin phosphotransferase